MDSYISRRTEYDKIKRPKNDPEDVVPEKKKKGSIISKVVDIVSGDDVSGKGEENYSDDEFEEEYEEAEEKGGFFSGIKKWFSSDVEEVVEEEYEPELPEDLKDILRIQNKWLKKLPAKEMKLFKESQDYQVYKDVLKRYGLIK